MAGICICRLEFQTGVTSELPTTHSEPPLSAPPIFGKLRECLKGRSLCRMGRQTLPKEMGLKGHVSSRWMIRILTGLSICAAASAQSTDSPRKTKSTPPAEITRFSVEEAKKDSGFETGPLHIIYSDGTKLVKTLPPLKSSTGSETIFNAVGFSGVQLAADGQTLGWTINVENCCTSYSIPFRVVVFRHKRVLHTFEQGQMVWDWMFLQGGERVAVVFGPTHGTAIGDYRLFDVKSGRLLSEIFGDTDTQALKSDAPAWARRLQEHRHNN